MMELADFAALTDVQWRTRTEVERGIYIAEGTKTIARAIAAGHTLRSVITEERWVASLIEAGIPSSAITVEDAARLEEITGYHVHRGALAAFERPAPPVLQDLLASARRVVVIEDVVDHANVGAIMRSAAAFDIDAVLLTPACADPLYRRSIKVAMGAVFAVPWTRIPWPAGLATLREAGFTTLALTPEQSALDIRSLPDTILDARIALLLGTEGDGLSGEALRGASHRVRIPMSHAVDSLNVAAAAAVACFAVTR